MLRGISSCLRGSKLPSEQRFRRPSYRSILVYTSFQREFSSVGVENGGNSERAAGRSIDQSFTSSHYMPDGRRFQFATAVVRSMKKGESPFRIWDQACALIGGNNPSVAVAFVSKPTESAIRTVQALAGQMSASLSESSDRPRVPIPSTSSSAAPQSVSLNSEIGTTSRPSTEHLTGPSHVPLIGCIFDDSAGEIETSGDSGSKTVQVKPNGSSRAGSKFVSQVNEGHIEGSPQFGDGLGQQVDQGLSVGGFRLGSSVRALDDLQEEDEDDEEGTVSDWEDLCREYGEEAIKILDSGVDSEDGEDDCENSSADQISKEGLVSFLNALVRHRSPLEDSGFGSDLRALKRRDENPRMQTAPFGRAASCDVLVTELERCLNSSELGSPPTHGVSQRVYGDYYENTITVEPRKGEGGDRGGVSSSDVKTEEVDYKLILCVGHMPGVKAVAFHSSTTGLPRLPDLENAVLENNPHMLLLGAPGFVFPDFMQRLSSVFPASCRAGAFLSPLFTRKKNQWARDATENEAIPLFIGDQTFTSGVVGLAISSKVKGLEVPAGAFAEFTRMSLGMPRIHGYVFLDEPVSRNLFLPNNVTLQNAFGASKGSKVSPSSLLEQLNERLLKESPLPPRPQVSGMELNVVDDPERSLLLSSNPTEEEALGASDRLPLALLDSVLFPGWSTAFYIYEPCYRLMVRQCVEQGKPFGLSSMYSGSWAADAAGTGEVIGTLVNLKIHTFERDCRSYIIAQGVRRFKVVNERIWSEPGSFGLTMGQVQFFDDKECETATEKQELLDLAKRAVSLCCEVASEAQSAPGLIKSVHDPRLASFAIGHVLNVPTRVKRRWLKMVNTKTRLLEQMTFLQTKVPSSS